MEDNSEIRVLIVDDSAIVRGLIVRGLEQVRGVQVCGRAADGAAALAELDRSAPDVVVLDLEMPGMDGMTALPRILERRPDVRIIIASTLSQRNARISLEALQKGAHDYVPKPESLVGAEDFHRELAAKVLALGRRPSTPGRFTAPGPALPASTPRAEPKRPSVLAIGGSTGAPPVLLKLFRDLRGVTLPILLVQHMPAGFTALLAEQLARAGERPCAEGRDGEPILAGRAYVAPADWHMTVGHDGGAPVIRLNREPHEHYCRPAVDPLLKSAAEIYGAGLMAVILTGMGVDGAEGCRVAVSHGGRFVAQDEASSVVWGMPGAAARTGLAEAVAAPDEIARRIRMAADA